MRMGYVLGPVAARKLLPFVVRQLASSQPWTTGLLCATRVAVWFV